VFFEVVLIIFYIERFHFKLLYLQQIAIVNFYVDNTVFLLNSKSKDTKKAAAAATTTRTTTTTTAAAAAAAAAAAIP